MPPPIDRPATFDLSDLFFSTTDRKGRIVTCNDVFMRIAGYSSEELLGRPHNIIRHPDMPKCVFKLLWDTLLADRPIGAYVKNMTSSGEFYWVFALALPIENGFLSVRLKPTTSMKTVVEKLYAQMLATEKTYGQDSKKGMGAASSELVSVLSGMGFESYESFMVSCLRAEISSRFKSMNDEVDRNAIVGDGGMVRVFGELGRLEVLRQEASDQAVYLETVSRNIRRIALNANVCAARMKSESEALGVLSERASDVAADILDQAQKLDCVRTELTTSLEATSFQVSLSTLLSEMNAFYGDEIRSSQLRVDEQISTYGDSFESLSNLLGAEFSSALAGSDEGRDHLRLALASFESLTREFGQTLQVTRIIGVTGRSLVAGLEDGDQFSRLLNEMVTIAEDARANLELLRSSASKVDRIAQNWNLRRGQLAA